jgi:hypothetical protein
MEAYSTSSAIFYAALYRARLRAAASLAPIPAGPGTPARLFVVHQKGMAFLEVLEGKAGMVRRIL